jgi:hypothetical protein
MNADQNPEFAKIIERSTNTIPAFKAPSEFTFSIMLDSDEMSPTCPANSYAIFDPTLEAANESLVLVAPKNTTRAFFTQIFFKQGSTFTETLKRGSPTLPLEKGFKICGVYLDTFYP